MNEHFDQNVVRDTLGEEQAGDGNPGDQATSTHYGNEAALRRPYHGNRYGDVSVGGSGVLIQGNNVTINHPSPDSTSRKKLRKKALDSLFFPGMHSRFHNVSAAMPRTCQWIFTHEGFQKWADPMEMEDHHGFLWIKGKPGSGKSTIMRETLLWARRNWPDQIVISYFFNARSQGTLEKSILGLYQSLVHQLILAQDDVFESFRSEFSTDDRIEMSRSWSETELSNFILGIAQSGCFGKPVNIFVDALDEGQDGEIREMVSFLEDLAVSALSCGSPLRICLSSRHYPHITIDHGVTIVLDDQDAHKKDIELYVQKKLPGMRHVHMNKLRQRILEKSAGVFLWVVLVVPMLRQMNDRGQSFAEMMKKLATVPNRIHDLFTDILNREGGVLEARTRLLTWLLYALEPLTPRQLYLICRMGAASFEDIHAIPDAETVERYIIDCSHGLVELTKSLPQSVQFIHETVRDYLRDSRVQEDLPGVVPTPSSNVANFDASFCHASIASDCLQYLLGLCAVPSLDPRANSLQWRRGDAPDFYILARYSAVHWWQHAQKTWAKDRAEVSKQAFELISLKSIGQRIWLQFLTRGRSLDRAPLLHRAVLIGLPEVVLRVLSLDAEIDAHYPQYGTALSLAAEFEFVSIAAILMSSGAQAAARGCTYVESPSFLASMKNNIGVMLLLDQAKLRCMGVEPISEVTEFMEKTERDCQIAKAYFEARLTMRHVADSSTSDAHCADNFPLHEVNCETDAMQPRLSVSIGDIDTGVDMFGV